MQYDVVRAGVIGVGTMGERHARVYAQSPGARLVGVYDADFARARAVAARWETTAFATVEQLLDAVDAVSIASSTHTHAALATQALDHDTHLLIEKPLADSLDDARAFAARAARRPDITVQVGHIERFNPVVREVQQLVRGRRILSVALQRLSPFDGRCLDSDVIQDLMIHDLDLALAFCGDSLELLRASGEAVMTARIDDATSHFRALHGARITLRASRVADRKVRAFSILTDDAWIDADLMDKSLTVSRRRPGFGRASGERRAVAADEPLRLELEHFLACVRERRQPVVGVEDGVRALTHAEAVGALIAVQAAPQAASLVVAGEGVAAGD